MSKSLLEEYYLTDLTFHSLIDSWVDNKQCPLVLVDWLLEHDLPIAADCARWAATEELRFIDASKTTKSYPYPGDNKRLYWWFVGGLNDRGYHLHNEYARFVPYKNLNIRGTTQLRKTAQEAIIDLLNQWRLSND